MQIPWSHPETDVRGLIADLDLHPLPARILTQAADRITDCALRAFVTLALLSSDPHRIARRPGPACSGYRGAGGRSLRAAVLIRAVHLLSPSLPDVDEAACLAATLLTTAVPDHAQDRASLRSCAVSQWLGALICRDQDHLVRWGCRPSRLHRVQHLVSLAAARAHLAYTRSSGTPTETVVVLSCRAAEIADPAAVGPGGDRPCLPAWMDPDIAPRTAERLLWDDLTERPEQISRGATPSPPLDSQAREPRR